MRTLLLADDNITVQRVIALTFAEQDIQVVSCSDGQQAMERMAAQPPDIVLAGTSLPAMNGYELARFIRNQPGLKDVPVLLLSGAFENVDEARVVSSGANGVIEKPVEPNNVIGRVKELLGLKSEAKPATPPGRLITPAAGPKEKKLPPAAPPRVVTSTKGTPSKWEQLREQTGLEPNARSVEDASPKPADYLDTLDAAFDTLDQQLSGRAANAKPSRNPSGPLGQSSGAPDPRSPGRQPKDAPPAPAAGNPVFEVDDEWFGAEDSKLADARAGRREIQEDLRAPELQPAAAEAAPNAVFEVDEAWFAEDNKARAAKLEEHRTLAAEMGIHEVDLPPVEPAPNAAAPVSAQDFDFGLDDIKRLQESAPPTPVVEEVPHAAVATPELIEEMAPPVVESAAPMAAELDEFFAEIDQPSAFAQHASVDEQGLSPHVVDTPRGLSPHESVTPQAPQAPQAAQAPYLADDFAELLAFEQGERHEPPKPPAPEVRYVAPEITDDMLEQIAARVADRLNSGPFGEQIKDAMMSTIRDVTKVVAYEASERIIREVAAEASERVVRDVAHAASDRVMREVAQESSDRVVREVAHETADRVVREIASETSERVAREITAETSARVVRDVVAETSERLVRDEIDRIKSKHQ